MFGRTASGRGKQRANANRGVNRDGLMTAERREGNTGRSLEDWESWVDEAIRGARTRGDFDNLSGAGKPLNLERNPFAGDREAGFHVLKNADLAPYWMELDKELKRSVASLESFRERAAIRLRRLRGLVRAADAAATPDQPTRRGAAVWRWLRGPATAATVRNGGIDLGSVERERLHARLQYLDRAETVDKLIGEYNAALPAEIRWLERPRLLPEHAADQFDRDCPPVISDDGGEA